MASTSAQMASDSSPSNLGWTYDVFLSFRGEDTRNNFTSHLYTDLVRKGIRTFRDDKLPRGEKIAPELLNAIEKSRSSIIVFSKTYADSRWCLDELAKIMECRQEYRQKVLPIFYHVDPSDVRKQTGRFGEAFTRHEENWKNKVQSWREALTEAGNISGWHVKEGYESEHINNITTTIANSLNCKLLFVGDNLVGMDSHFRKIILGLSMESNDVRMVGICGIGGIESLVGDHSWYGKGSRIIITTRDKRWLTKLNVDYLYEVEGLKSDEALELFSQYAFRPNLPKEDFKILSYHVIYYCQGEDRDFASKIWEQVEIVREQHPKDPSKWSRLWNPDDIYRAFISEERMQNVETISLDLSRSKEIWFTTNIFAKMKKVFVKMKNLRFLKVYSSHELPSSIERLKRLTRLELSNCDKLETLPNSIELDVGGCNLMEGAIPSDLWCLFSLESLNVSENNIRCIPVGIIQLSQLDILRMNHCPMLEEIPELQSSLRWIGAHGCPCLETLSSDPMHPLWSSLLNCFKSQIQDFECPTRSKYYCETRVVIPGSRGIPEWISHKSMGSEITIDLPKNWYEDNNFLGFALFNHHVPLDYDHDLLNPTLDLLMSHGNRFEYMHRIWFSPEDPELMVAYFPQIAISSKYRSNRWNNFKARFYGPYGRGAQVESCGIHLIYNKAQDHSQQTLQLFNVKRSHG
ncbi:TMV resistance protein N [Vitis vinifera]|uniref:TMV resistance protein N n=1 Tax=Vitis vinifera TaxID=29760 RepID=A0A438FJG2_VITVI|nr:TMV resistance protein N [Vitis vinifera]